MDSEAPSAAASDVEDDGEPAFDPTQDLSQMSEKERKKWDKNIQKWQIFMDFLFRHVAIAAFKYNCFEKEDLVQFMIALERAEDFREKMKLKKGEVARISSLKVMKESTEILVNNLCLNEANRVRRYLDICGRMKGIAMIAGGFYKALKKGKVKNLDKIKYYLDYWKGFTSRMYDFGELQFRNANPDTFNELEKKYLVWTTVLRTSLNLAQKFLKKCSDATGLDIVNKDPKVQLQHMQAAEYVVGKKMEQMLFEKVVKESKNYLMRPHSGPRTLVETSEDRHHGSAAVLLGGGASRPSTGMSTGSKWEMPDMSDIDPALLQPIDDSSMLLRLPEEPPKDKKKKKGKGKGKGKGSAKGGGKKKKKK